MDITLMMVGKTTEKHINEGIAIYVSRLKHYVPFKMVVLPVSRSSGVSSARRIKNEEAEGIVRYLKPDDYLVLLDERGKEYTSAGFADFLQGKMNSGLRNLVFLVGGPYGFDESIVARANGMLSLSLMTFPHQMVRLFFIEQLYRAMTILRNEGYHH